MTEREDYLRRNLEITRIQLLKCLPKNMGGTKIETSYGKAYQDLVRANLDLQIKKKYRLSLY